MRHDQGDYSDRCDWLAKWTDELRKGLVEELDRSRIAEIAALAGTAVVASTALASAANAAVSQGGMTMSIGQAIASSGGAKLAAGGLAAALALGGGAMATGNLACEFPAPSTQVEGNLLVQTGLDGSAHAQVEQRTIEVEGLGFVDVAHNDADVEVLGIRLEDCSTAEVRSEGQGGAEIDFTLDGVTRTLMVSVVDGDLLASMSPSVASDASISGDVATEAEVDAEAEGALDVQLDAEADSATALDLDGDIDISSEADADGDGILGGLGLGGDTGILGGLGFGFDADMDN